MKYIVILIAFLLIGCTASVQIQPHIQPSNPSIVFDDNAGIYISADNYNQNNEKFNFLVGKKIKVPLITPLKEMSQETFAPYFKQVYSLGKIDYSSTPYIIEIDVVDFKVTAGLDTHIIIQCKVSTETMTLMSDTFKGSGKGFAIVGLNDDDDDALEEVKKSAEKAFEQVFQNIRLEFDKVLQNDKY